MTSARLSRRALCIWEVARRNGGRPVAPAVMAFYDRAFGLLKKRINNTSGGNDVRKGDDACDRCRRAAWRDACTRGGLSHAADHAPGRLHPGGTERRALAHRRQEARADS